jgi:hypothetical protein
MGKCYRIFLRFAPKAARDTKRSADLCAYSGPALRGRDRPSPTPYRVEKRGVPAVATNPVNLPNER